MKSDMCLLFPLGFQKMGYNPLCFKKLGRGACWGHVPSVPHMLMKVLPLDHHGIEFTGSQYSLESNPRRSRVFQYKRTPESNEQLRNWELNHALTIETLFHKIFLQFQSFTVILKELDINVMCGHLTCKKRKLKILKEFMILNIQANI